MTDFQYWLLNIYFCICLKIMIFLNHCSKFLKGWSNPKPNADYQEIILQVFYQFNRLAANSGFGLNLGYVTSKVKVLRSMCQPRCSV